MISKERFHTEHYGAHSGSRSGLSDYNDGGFDHFSYIEEIQDDVVGKVAYGNDNDNELTDDEYDDKYHSGL